MLSVVFALAALAPVVPDAVAPPAPVEKVAAWSWQQPLLAMAAGFGMSLPMLAVAASVPVAFLPTSVDIALWRGTGPVGFVAWLGAIVVGAGALVLAPVMAMAEVGIVNGLGPDPQAHVDNTTPMIVNGAIGVVTVGGTFAALSLLPLQNGIGVGLLTLLAGGTALGVVPAVWSTVKYAGGGDAE
jgi:hypothetical protein